MTHPNAIELHDGGDENAAIVYLARLTSAQSRRVQKTALDNIARLIDPALDAYSMQWQRLRYKHTQVIRASLVEMYAPATVNRHLSALKGVLKESWRLNLMSQEEMARASDLPSVSFKAEPSGRAIDSAELLALLNTCDYSEAHGMRNYVMLALLGQCGLRREELVALNIGDVNMATGRIQVRMGKGRKDRPAFAAGRTLEVLNEWILLRTQGVDLTTAEGREQVKDLPLFTSIDTRFERLTAQAIYYIVGAAAEKAGVEDLSPHSFRRYFVTTMLENGEDISVVQAMAGHADVKTTIRYDRRGEKAMAAAAKRMKLPE